MAPRASRRQPDGNLERFSGFADDYDSARPSPPATLANLVKKYAGSERANVADLGSGTGLSSRWAAGWARSVVGIEPNPDMRAVAQGRPLPGVEYREGTGDRTGLDTASIDVVLAVQAMHWMDPGPTIAEVARILRTGGVFAVVDADWPPVCGVAAAEAAWVALQKRIRVLEARVARGEEVGQLTRNIEDTDPDLRHDDATDPHINRVLPGGTRSWPKSKHLEHIASSGYFSFSRELLISERTSGGERRFIALMASQGSYRGLRKVGLSDDDIGMSRFVEDAKAAFGASTTPARLSFCWRARIGVRNEVSVS